MAAFIPSLQLSSWQTESCAQSHPHMKSRRSHVAMHWSIQSYSLHLRCHRSKLLLIRYTQSKSPPSGPNDKKNGPKNSANNKNPQLPQLPRIFPVSSFPGFETLKPEVLIENIFRNSTLDLNDDGYVSVQEAKDALLKSAVQMGPYASTVMDTMVGGVSNAKIDLKKLDHNGDGKISAEELRAAMMVQAGSVAKQAKVVADTQYRITADKVQNAAKRLNIKGDVHGKVDIRDAVLAMKRSMGTTSEIVDQRFDELLLGIDSELDVDQDGRVSVDEFQKVVSRRATVALETTGTALQRLATKLSRRLTFVVTILLLASVALNFVAKAGGLTLRSAAAAAGIVLSTLVAIRIRMVV